MKRGTDYEMLITDDESDEQDGGGGGKRPVTYKDVQRKIEGIADSEHIHIASRRECWGCDQGFFVVNPEPIHIEISNLVKRCINYVHLDILWDEIYHIVESKRNREKTTVDAQKEWTREQIKEHFEYHINDAELERRFQIDFYRGYGRILKDSLLQVDENGKEDTIDKNYKLLLATHAKVINLIKADTSSSQFSSATPLTNSNAAKKR